LPFLLSALTVLFITMLTVIFHTVKAAVANPAKNLRTEWSTWGVRRHSWVVSGE